MPFADPLIQGLIADAVHQATSRLFEPSVAHVLPINTIGCFVLQHLMQRDYRPVAGAVEIATGGTPLALDAGEAYVWIEARHEDGRIELVDFAARYWRDQTKRMGTPWEGETLPDPVWVWKDECSFAQYREDAWRTTQIRQDIAHAVAERDPEGPVQAWEDAINDAIHYIASTEEGMDLLIRAGLAEPIDGTKEER